LSEAEFVPILKSGFEDCEETEETVLMILDVMIQS